MRLLPSDPEIQVIINKIAQNRLNLQPDFQRGEVWTIGKKKRLIDTILREWHVPPIHVVVDPDKGTEEVLDGQQRLAAIRDFRADKFTIDGTIEPMTPELLAENGKRFSELPQQLRYRFENFTIRYFKIVDYTPDEPGELFFRLNQPTNLTPAEKRNSFYGPVRVQIKEMVHQMNEWGIDRAVLGFTNLRMAYDDVLARVCFSLEAGTLQEKVTSSRIEARFRSGEGFQQGDIDRVMTALRVFSRMPAETDESVRFNKATFFSWLLFLSRMDAAAADPRTIVAFITSFESERASVRRGTILESSCFAGPTGAEFVGLLINIFNDRAGSRVADVSSVLLRDLITWFYFARQLGDDVRHVLAAGVDSKLNVVVALINEIERTRSPEDPSAALEDALLNVATAARWEIL